MTRTKSELTLSTPSYRTTPTEENSASIALTCIDPSTRRVFSGARTQIHQTSTYNKTREALLLDKQF
ncbi:hypothetical protein TNCV_857451 [Trichonephila clavipes]|nr:hypothetical protein TNCV_857451 [Trichonephila clavipes]